MMKTTKQRCLLAAVLLLLAVFAMGCGYTFEEIDAIQQYQKQGKKNAKEYIEGKYGFKAKVVDTKCEYLVGGFDFSPPPSGDVYVTMEYEGQQFLVDIPGDVETTEGSDNYQYEEIRAAMEQALYEITNIPAEDMFLFYGYYWDFTEVNMGHNGLIPMYFDGTNLVEVLDGYDPAIQATYAEQDIGNVDMVAIQNRLKVDDCQLINYASKEYYDFLKDKYHGAYGITSVDMAEENLPYVKSYCILDYDEVTYVEPQLTTLDDILVYTENATDQVCMEKDVPDLQDAILDNLYREYSGNEKDTSYIHDNVSTTEEQLIDTYVLHSDAKCVHIFIPVDKWAGVDMEFREIDWRFWRNFHKIYQTWQYSDDEKYIGTKVYFLDYDNIAFTVMAIEDN